MRPSCPRCYRWPLIGSRVSLVSVAPCRQICLLLVAAELAVEVEAVAEVEVGSEAELALEVEAGPGAEDASAVGSWRHYLHPLLWARCRLPKSRLLRGANSLSVRPWEDQGRQVSRRVEPPPQSSSARRACGGGSACAGDDLRRCSTHYTFCQSGTTCSWLGRTYRARYRWSSKPCAFSCGRGWYDVAAHVHCGSHRDSLNRRGTSGAALCATASLNRPGR